MASVSLTRVIEKMKLENLTPEIDVKHVKITQPDINRPALQLAGYFEHFDATPTADCRICGIHLYGRHDG